MQPPPTRFRLERATHRRGDARDTPGAPILPPPATATAAATDGPTGGRAASPPIPRREFPPMFDPASLKFLKSHEWLHVDGDVATVGVSDFAQQALNDVVFVELPDVGRSVTKGDAVAVLESCKAAADVYAPVSGEIIEVNDALGSRPEIVNQSPFGDGWLFKVRVAGFDPADPDYLDAGAYEKQCGA